MNSAAKPVTGFSGHDLTESATNRPDKAAASVRGSLSSGERVGVQGSAGPENPNVAGALTRPASSRSGGIARRLTVIAFAFVASALLLISLKLPLWQMRLEAPQYRDEEALRVSVHPNAMYGDLRELSVLNRYIGVHVPSALPQFRCLPAAITAGAVLVLCAAFMPLRMRRLSLIVSGLVLVGALATAVVQAKSQIYKIGHDRDQHTPLVGVKDFTPPFLGTAKIAQFEVSSRFGLGAWLIGVALALQFGAAWLSGHRGAAVAPGTNPGESAVSETGDQRDAPLHPARS